MDMPEKCVPPKNLYNKHTSWKTVNVNVQNCYATFRKNLFKMGQNFSIIINSANKKTKDEWYKFNYVITKHTLIMYEAVINLKKNEVFRFFVCFKSN